MDESFCKSKYANVLVEIPKLGTRTFSYGIPDELRPIIKIGQPVLVPFGFQGTINAFVVGFGDYLPEGIKAKNIYEILEETPIFDLEYLRFLEWTANYYCCNLQTVMSAAIPMNFFAKTKRIVRLLNTNYSSNKFLKDELKIMNELDGKDFVNAATLQKKLKISSSKFYEILRKLKKNEIIAVENIIEQQNQKTQFEKSVKFINKNTSNKRHLEILELLELKSSVLLKDFESEAKTTRTTIKKLEAEGFLEIIEDEIYRNPLCIFGSEQRESFPPLNPQQEKAYERIAKAVDEKDSQPLLLYGITGSGKTEVYFKAIQKVLDEGKNALFLAPEIPIASQLAKRLAKRFGTEEVAIWHSSISEGEKFDVWQKIRNGKIRILAGARSGIFAPLKNIGLIIIDEEHEGTYKQTTPAPRYNAKTLAEKLAEQMNAALVLGSATPDVLTYYKAKNSNRLMQLPERYGKSVLAKTYVIDMKNEYADANKSLFSRPLKSAIEANIKDKKQTILLINRRGFSTYTQCEGCGYVVECKKCAIPLIFHKNTMSHRCHYCGFEQAALTECPECGSEAIKSYGIGTQRVEEAVLREFPDAICARIDSDILSKKNAHIELLDRFSKGEIDILIGTQMIAKGLDNPNVTLVGVLSADTSFNLPDFRASERGFQLLTQVAGRAGRGADEGRVYFQTYSPNYFVMESAEKQDYLSFYKEEIQSRQDLSYPPFSQMIRIIISSENEFRAERLTQEVALRLNSMVEKHGISEKLEVLPPNPCVISKIRDDYRFHIIIKNRLEQKGHFFVTNFISKMTIPDDIKMIVDVDPLDML